MIDLPSDDETLVEDARYRAELDEEVEAAGRAVAAAESDAERAEGLARLSLALSERFTWTGSIDDINASVAAGRQAVETASADDPELPDYLSRLGIALLGRY